MDAAEAEQSKSRRTHPQPANAESALAGAGRPDAQRVVPARPLRMADRPVASVPPRPVPARPPRPGRHEPALFCVQLILAEKLTQFSANLALLARADAPELVHQARVGWRRFNSSLRFYRPLLRVVAGVPGASDLNAVFAAARAELAGLRSALREVRELDVALHETLPPVALDYVRGDLARQRHWEQMLVSLGGARRAQRELVQSQLRRPAVRRALAALQAGIEVLPHSEALERSFAPDWTFADWARQRLRRLRRQLKRARQAARQAAQQLAKSVAKSAVTVLPAAAGTEPTTRVAALHEAEHRVRLLAKRLRYEIESLAPWLPRRWRKQRLKRAMRLQARLGAQRDLMQAATLVARHAAASSTGAAAITAHLDALVAQRLTLRAGPGSPAHRNA